jgi:hypothetical protein
MVFLLPETFARGDASFCSGSTAPLASLAAIVDRS